MGAECVDLGCGEITVQSRRDDTVNGVTGGYQNKPFRTSLLRHHAVRLHVSVRRLYVFAGK